MTQIQKENRYYQNKRRERLCKNQVQVSLKLKIERTFKSWFYELKEVFRRFKAEIELEIEQAKMYYFGGYSPKMVVLEILRIPIGWDAI